MIDHAPAALLAFAGSVMLALALPVQLAEAKTRPATEVLKGFDPEPELVRIYTHIVQGRTADALQATDALIARAPNFRLAHLIRGDLLLARIRPINALGAGANAPEDRLRELREEARQRLEGYRNRPPAGTLPGYFFQLAPSQTRALVMDTRRSRLYLFENDGKQIRLAADYYITQGRNGDFKEKEGDQRTPVGVYSILSAIPRAKLTDFYGPAALPINYPNEWDRLNNRTGSGIWFHGVPSDTFSRPPKASDGCMVLANEDMARLAKVLPIGHTPVVLSESVEWVTPQQLAAERGPLLKAFEGWQRDWQAQNFVRYAAHYSKDFRGDGNGNPNLATWLDSRRTLMQGSQRVLIDISNVSMFRYPGVKSNMVLVEFHQRFRSNALNSNVKKRQYWQLENGVWRIIFEGNT